ncbi:MAG: hypothetical protein EOP06_04050 [Proteobacteria bacterium]|nr:MAG: hypothetical protein EOP06_04050 [Pseudomonadota bacterium]
MSSKKSESKIIPFSKQSQLVDRRPTEISCNQNLYESNFRSRIESILNEIRVGDLSENQIEWEIAMLRLRFPLKTNKELTSYLDEILKQRLSKTKMMSVMLKVILQEAKSNRLDQESRESLLSDLKAIEAVLKRS